MSETIDDSKETVDKLASVIQLQKEKLGRALEAKERSSIEIDPDIERIIAAAKHVDSITLREMLDLSKAARLEDGSLVGVIDGRGITELRRVRAGYATALDALASS